MNANTENNQEAITTSEKKNRVFSISSTLKTSKGQKSELPQPYTEKQVIRLVSKIRSWQWEN